MPNGVQYWTYPGRTIPIKISRVIECSQVYKLRLVISNISDSHRDSGVFLKKGSLKSPSTFISNLVANPTLVCEGESLNLTVNGDIGYTYVWSDGQSGVGLKSINTTATLGVNNYTVTAYSANGCAVNSLNVDVVVHPNNNEQPFINGINNTGNYKAYVRAGETINFQIPTFDHINEAVYFFHLNTLGGANHSFINQNHQIGTFSWTPTDAQIGEHQFQVFATDNNVCNQMNSEIYTFTIIVICRYCEIGIEYANRFPNNNPVPPLTEMAEYIIAGVSGEVVIGEPTVFRAGEYILYGGDWDSGDDFEDFIEPVCDDQVCDECCDDNPPITFTTIPNVFTPNGDGINDVWYVPDFENPFCAFNAQRFELQIFNRWDQLVYSLSANHNNCCPFSSPPNADAGGYSSIYWDGSLNNGGFVDDTHYGYILRIWGCNNSFFDQAGTISVYGLSARYSNENEVENQEISFEEIINYSRGIPDSSISTLKTKEIIVYPNPLNDIFTIKLINFEDDKVSDFHYNITNALGQTIEAGRLTSDEYTINSYKWSSGIYFCRVNNENYAQKFKILKR